MTISTGAFKIASTKKNIAKRLASQTMKLQEDPEWMTIGKTLLPYAAMLAAPWAGGLIGGLGTGTGIGSSFFKGLGTALSSGSKLNQAQGPLQFLKGMGAKSIFGHLIKTGGRKGMEKLSGKDVTDISVGDDALSRLLGGEAETQVRGDYLSAKKADEKTDIIGTIASAFEAQGGLESFQGLFGDKSIPYAPHDFSKGRLEDIIAEIKGGGGTTYRTPLKKPWEIGE